MRAIDVMVGNLNSSADWAHVEPFSERSPAATLPSRIWVDSMYGRKRSPGGIMRATDVVIADLGALIWRHRQRQRPHARIQV